MLYVLKDLQNYNGARCCSCCCVLILGLNHFYSDIEACVIEVGF